MDVFKFRKLLLNVLIEVQPNYMENTEEGVHNYFKKYILKYSEKLNGILLTYEILGVDKIFEISHFNGSLIVKSNIEVLVLNIRKGGKVKLYDNMVLGVFKTDIEADFINIEDILIDENFYVTIKGKSLES